MDFVTHLRNILLLCVLSLLSSCGNGGGGTPSPAPPPATPVDQAIKIQWSGMTDALLAKDKQTAMSYLTDEAQLQYGPVFDILMPEFPAILPTWSPPIVSKISSDTAEYAIVTDDGIKRQVFYVYYKLGDDGIWRLESM